MRDFLKRSGRWLSAAWFWPLVLLALPTCGLDSSGIGGSPPPFDPGPAPATSAIMCDIAKVPGEGPNCADSTETGYGMSLAHAAVALAQGESSSLALDFSQDATNACGGLPQKVELQGPFPDGYAVCLNCGAQIPAVYADPTAACVAQCKDLTYFSDGPLPDEGVDAFCAANAHVSTNFDKNMCFDNACSDGGTLLPNFVDPRRTPEQVKWVDLIGTSASGNSLTRTAPTTGAGNADFNAGAASGQTITKGDAWVEFEASETNLSHVLALRASCADISICPDTDPSLGDTTFSISLNSDGKVYVLESDGLNVTVLGPFGDPYAVGERFRVKVVDNNDGKATISYSRLVGPCTQGTVCNEIQLAQHVGAAPQYPLRVDASFREQNATLANVTIVRIR